MKNDILVPFPLFLSLLLACFLLGAIVGTLVTYLLVDSSPKTSSNPNWIQQLKEEQKAVVKEVIDGDTIVVVLPDQREVYIRYLGIDAPENKVGSPPSYYAQESLAKNQSLVQGKTVTLTWDKQREDRQLDRIRLLAYVSVDNISVNAEMLRRGCATLYRRREAPVQHKKLQEFEILENEAKANQIGLWNTKAKEQWEREHNLRAADNPILYVADDQFFHREECPKVKEIRIKRYYYKREDALKDVQICPLCKP